MSARPKQKGAKRAVAKAPERIVSAIVARALVARDPIAILHEARDDEALPIAVRRALSAADDDGIRITALLVAKLRFERLLQGSVKAGAAFDADPRGFTALFRRYHEEVPPTALFPPQEAALFAAWSRGQGIFD